MNGHANRISVVAIILFLAFSVLLSASGTAVAQTVPLFRLVEQRRIDSDETSPERSLSTVNGLTVLTDGSVVVFQGTDMLVRIYNAQGRFIRAVGGRGQGPGEYSSMNRTGGLGNTFWIFDFAASRITVTGGDGIVRSVRPINRNRPGVRYTFLSFLPGDRRLVSYLYAPLAAGRGQAAGAPSSTRDVDSTVYAVEDSAGRVLTRLYKFVPSDRQPIRVRVDTTERVIPQGLVGAVAFAAASDGSGFVLTIDSELWGGREGQVRILRGDTSGRVVSTTDISLPPVRVTDAYLDSVAAMMASSLTMVRGRATGTDAQRSTITNRIRDQMFAPAHFPVTPTLLLGSDGSLWLRPTYERDEWTVMINNRPARRVRVPEDVTLRVVSADQVWGVRTNSSGVPSIVHYRLDPGSGSP